MSHEESPNIQSYIIWAKDLWCLRKLFHCNSEIVVDNFVACIQSFLEHLALKVASKISD